jgi:hypothetical protein
MKLHDMLGKNHMTPPEVNNEQHQRMPNISMSANGIENFVFGVNISYGLFCVVHKYKQINRNGKTNSLGCLGGNIEINQEPINIKA